FEIQRAEREPPNAAQPTAREDTLGRFGFVITIAASVLAISAIDRWSRRISPITASVAVPGALVVSLFGAFAVTWSVNSQLLLYAFRPGVFSYVEWLSQTSNLALARGIANVWTPYPQGTQDVVVLLQILSNAASSWASSDIWTAYTIFRLLFHIVFLLVPS